jgi:hypothetical protein
LAIRHGHCTGHSVAEVSGKLISEISMKSKALIAMAVAGVFWSAGSIANQTGLMTTGPSDASESTPSMSTITSLDTRTGGYKGWGPMANPHTPSGVDESNSLASVDEEREHKQQLAEVKSERDQVWVANAPLRAEYENIGATRSEAGGFGRFFSR